MNKIVLSLLAVLLLCPTVLADGMVFTYDEDRWDLHSENQQLAAINHENGFENMLISINMDINDRTHAEKAVWVFPVPAGPHQVTINILNEFPEFRGADIDTEYDTAVGRVGLCMVGYSTFPASLLPFILTYTLSAATLSGEMDGVTVHERIEKTGLTSELITTKDQESLDRYLQSKGLDLPESSKRTLDEYVGEDYSFVVSYISNLTQLKTERPRSRAEIMEAKMKAVAQGFEGEPEPLLPPQYMLKPIGVFVRFPTEKMYFPLKPTSAYGSRQIPILLYVVGYAKPALYSEIASQSAISYYRQGSYAPTGDLASFFNGRTKMNGLKYTRIKIDVPSEHLVEDLWIEHSASLRSDIKSFLAVSVWVWGPLLFIVLSMVASLLAGRICFRKTHISDEHLLRHGLWNCLTMVGFIPATIFLRLTTAQRLRKIAYIFLFYLFFILLSVLAIYLLYWLPSVLI